MNCKQCNQPQAENELFCKNCGYQAPLEAQKAKVAQAKYSLKNIFIGHTHSVLFLIFSICFSVMTASQVINMFTGGIAGILGGILDAIFMIIATVGLWKCYTAKDNATLVGSFSKASIFDAFQSVMYTISIVLVSIVGAIVIILAFAGGSALGSVTDSDTSGGTFVTVIVLMLIMATIIVAMTLIKKIFANRRAYFLALSKYAENGVYTPQNAPIVGSFILGGWSALGAISSFASSALVAALLSLLGDLGELEFLEPIIASLQAGAILGGLSDLVLGGYYICSAIWMKSAHEAALAGQQAVSNEIRKYQDLETATKSAVVAYESERNAAARREREAAEEAAKKAQASMQEQQNAMMQMMMQQMMANAMNNNAAAAAPAAAPAAPAAAPAAPAAAPAPEAAPAQDAE